MLVIFFYCSACTSIKKNINSGSIATKQNNSWKIVFEDHFNTDGRFDENKWEYCTRGKAAWARYLTSSPDYVYQSNGNLNLKMDNSAIVGDTIPYHAAGIQTKGKFSFLYGKIEVRAQFKAGKGSWPAIWMMPETSRYGNWPKSGEIDIMEHVNNEKYIHQTIHNASSTNQKGVSTSTHTSTYYENQYHVYSVVWETDAVHFYINDTLQYTYYRLEDADYESWPFDQPFYVILNQSGGLGWPGRVDDRVLPFEMKVDWVKIYQRN